ncbi:MAG: IS66 family transposase [Verrucomicrobiota bacterium]
MTPPGQPTSNEALPQFTRPQLLELAKTAPEALVDLVLALQEQNRILRERVISLEARVLELEERVAKNSRNSDKPPGSDGLAKPPTPKSLRTKSGRNRGGQPGHRGYSLQAAEKPDFTVIHQLDHCPCGECAGCSLSDQPVMGYEKRQVFDLPPIRREVTEHQVEIKCCPHSGRQVRAEFPAGVGAPLQYGTRFSGLMVYLNQQQLLPFERLGRICEDLFGASVSVATLQSANENAYMAIEGFEAQVVQALVEAPMAHADESGLRIEGKLQWLHVVGTNWLTHYHVHPRRGSEAMDAANILPRRTGWTMHDFLSSYFHYGCAHAVCNQHLLRELRFFAEEKQESWAGSLMGLLYEFNTLSKTEPLLEEKALERCHARYQEILKAARLLHPRTQAGGKRVKQSKACNLLDRLEDYDQCVLAFLANPEVPFTNNQAEQDIRMIKVKQKISGAFRTLKGAQTFARIRGFFSTARKQGRDLLSSITEALEGRAFVPT